jgi:hypothetical protein
MSKISRELFRSSNNEALEQQLNVQRKFIDRMREAQQLFSEEYKRATGINENLKDEINKIILSFRATLDEFVNKLESDEPLKNAGLIIYRYNLLANGLKKLGYITLPITQKQEFTEELNDMIPKLEELIRYAEINNFTDLEQLKEIVNNFITGVFRTIGISSIKYTQGIHMEGRDVYNNLSSDLLELYNELIKDENKGELTLKEKSDIQHEINSIKKIGTKVKTEKSITPAIIKRLEESRVVFNKYLELLQNRKMELLPPQPMEFQQEQPYYNDALYTPNVGLQEVQPADQADQAVPQPFLNEPPTQLFLASVNRMEQDEPPIVETYQNALAIGMQKKDWDKYRKSKISQGWEFLQKGGNRFTGIRL